MYFSPFVATVYSVACLLGFFPSSLPPHEYSLVNMVKSKDGESNIFSVSPKLQVPFTEEIKTLPVL